MLTDDRPDRSIELEVDLERCGDAEVPADLDLLDPGWYQQELVTRGNPRPFTIPRGGFFG